MISTYITKSFEECLRSNSQGCIVNLAEMTQEDTWDTFLYLQDEEFNEALKDVFIDAHSKKSCESAVGVDRFLLLNGEKVTYCEKVQYKTAGVDFSPQFRIDTQMIALARDEATLSITSGCSSDRLKSECTLVLSLVGE